MKSTLKFIVFLALCYLALQNSFQCNVANCQYCSFPNQCGVCQYGSILTQNTTSGSFVCMQLTCPANCVTCYRNNICQQCASNFSLSSTGQCMSTSQNNTSTLPSNCLYGMSSQNCTLCAYGYTLNVGYCYPTIQLTGDDTNCLVKMTSSVCQICKSGYIVNTIGKCVQNNVNQNNCVISNCLYCTVANSTCTLCQPGFQLTSSNTCAQNCNSTGCASCSTNGSCATCAIGYLFNSTTQTCSPVGYGCSIQWCAFCSSSQSCTLCQPGFTLSPYQVNNSTTINVCIKLPCPFNITNCKACVSAYDTVFNFNKIVCAPNQCADNYVYLNGYCVPSLPNNTTFTCNVANCQNCSYNNFCSVCAAGYYLTRAGACQISSCNVPNCQSCGLNNICSQCANGYTLALGPLSLTSTYTNMVNFGLYLLQQQCVPSSITCNISNCAYCLQNNVCARCATGYDFSTTNSSMCAPACTIANCLQCVQSNQNLCAVCKPTFVSQNNGSQCATPSFSCAQGCANMSCTYNWNTQSGVCTQCMSGYTLYSGVCYSTTCNIYGCTLCSGWTSPVMCLSCQQGLILSNGYCMIPDCNNSVANCQNCVQSGKCIACKVGFNLQNSTNGTVTCLPANTTCVSNCLQCNANGSCITCATPYVAVNGFCVCSFQNCLDCSTSGLACNWCPQPLYASMQQPGCTPQPNLNYNINCSSVSNCKYCLSSSQCSVCAMGFRLSANLSCIINDCNSLGLSNCQLCDQWGVQCYLCQTNYTLDYLQDGGFCYLANNANYTCNITGCAACSTTNNSMCAACLPMYYANGATQCLPNSCNIANCYLCLLNNICTTCYTGYYLALDMSCQPFQNNYVNCSGNITYCSICVKGLINNSSQPYCIRCQDGFQFDSTNSICIPQMNSIQNCKIQTNQGINFQPICLVCAQGYYMTSFGQCSAYGSSPVINNTGCSVYNCLYCAVNSTTCSFCLSPWGISSVGGYCQTNVSSLCPANCQLCANSTLCFTCNLGYFVNNNSLCSPCTVTGCANCSNTNLNCSSCLTNYIYISASGGLCLSCNIPNCQNCSGNNVCSQCNSGYSLSDTGGACVQCDTTQASLANCFSCSSNNTCGVCNNGYQLYTNSNTNVTSCVQCNVSNCNQCSQNNVCAVCATGYSLNPNNATNQCFQCLSPCTACNPNGTCSQCLTPFYFKTPMTSSNGTVTCVVNTIPNCVNYTASNTTTCTGCNTGYSYNASSNTCVYNCPLNCQTCSGTTCSVCISGFYIGANNTCTQCISGCSTCNANSSTTCVTCFDGYYLTATSVCAQCPSYCAKCSLSTGSSPTVVCSTLSTQVQQKVLVQQPNGQQALAICQQNCLTCSNVNPLTCITCANGFYLSNGNCMPCASSCMTCNSQNVSQCFSCYPNSYLTGSSCLICNSSCLTCGLNAPNSCTSCYQGYYLQNTTSTCVAGCSLNCQYCSSPTVCTTCYTGYTLFTQNSSVSCVPCVSNCRVCAEGQPATCLQCGVGFYLSTSGSCIQCATNCLSCSAAGCLTCVDGFFLNSGATCSPNCVLPCATCSGVTPTKCLSCIAGYAYNSNAFMCVPQSTCSGACTVCPLGYTINLGQCIQCSTTNCQACLSTNVATCTSCSPGYYLASNQCIACPSSCATCLTSSGCLTCAIGYTTVRNIPITPSGYQCVACNSPCATCVSSPDHCTSCISGYQFSGWKCTQTFYFSFSLTLQTTLSTFNQNYLNFLNALTSSISGPNSNVVTISTITLGSVIVTGQAAPSAASGTKTSNQQFSSLDATLSANNQIAGMTITQATVNVVGGSVDYSQVNLALILGICIPVGVLIIAGIILYLYCKRKRSAENIIEKIKEDSGLNVRESFQLSANYKDSSRPFEENTSIN